MAAPSGKKLNMKALHPSMHLLFISICGVILMGCGFQHKIARSAQQLTQDELATAHIGIAVFDPEKNTYLYEHQSDKLFVPASNTKIITSYAGMKFLPTRIPTAVLKEIDTAVIVIPMGDPTFLHPEFSAHPLLDRLKKIEKPIYLTSSHWKTSPLGNGWSYEDFSEAFMTERSAFPVYGNQIHWFQEKTKKENPSQATDTVDLFIYSYPEINWPVDFGKAATQFNVTRAPHSNSFTLIEGKEKQAQASVPFITNGVQTGLDLLFDSLHKRIVNWEEPNYKGINTIREDTIFSQPTDSLLSIMMHRSDNFYADQILLMVSQLKRGEMNEGAIIDDLLSKELSSMPVLPRWIDGSGLSRYNLFSPSDMIHVLEKMRNELPWNRIAAVFPQSAEGTLRSISGLSGKSIIAKTGSMGGVLCLSGYVLSKQKKWLSFSIMINNHSSSGTVLRKKIGTFLSQL